MKIPDQLVSFLQKQGFVVVSTLDKKGNIHNSAKGIVETKDDKIYLIDLYKKRTFLNLKNNPKISITAIDERKFLGFTLKRKAKVLKGRIKEEILEKWEKKVIKRILKRVMRSIKEERKSSSQPEASFTSPKYLIEMEVEEVIDLVPAHLK
ncbi:MAG TPA: pyridoxamine 5'-phosphate oxidase family protein [Candidatus Omnitrophica bacterium]|nr:pyridoxamine 5'-phosphate oxidase family protein [Candidatus Omnitrophota bacterium]